MEYTPVRIVIDRIKALGAGEHVWVPARTSLHSLRVGLLRQAKKANLSIVTQKAIKHKKPGLKVYRVAES